MWQLPSQKEFEFANIPQLFSNLLLASIEFNRGMLEIVGTQDVGNTHLDPLNIGGAVSKAVQEILDGPGPVFGDTLALYRDYVQLVADTMSSWGHCCSLEGSTCSDFEAKDSRFKDEAWTWHPFFRFLKRSYYLNVKYIEGVLGHLGRLEPKELHQLRFYTKVFTDGLCPTNFAFFNPTVIDATLKTNGENLVQGALNFVKDVEFTKGHFQISSTDTAAFTVGKNIASTAGKVVYQNELMQLIQYEPMTKKVKATPIIMMPAWINKYYILDLQADNSFVRWVVEQGFTVFMISWKNPEASYRGKSFEDYMMEGPLAAIDVVKRITGVPSVNFLGYCLGGTLLATTLAYLSAKNSNTITAATFLTTLVDFKECGDVGIFIDERQISMLEESMNKYGYMDENKMGLTFSILRGNEMVWYFYINNYLLGQAPRAFDILHWNSDRTRLPASMHSYYLRNMYQRNLLAQPNGLSFGGVPIDLRSINIPVYILATRSDHIAPWGSVYKATQFYKGPVRFVLSSSGHVAGIVNPPIKNKYSYWVNDDHVADSGVWLRGATESKGSWWTDWINWLGDKSGDTVQSTKIKDFLEEAPGSYVLEK
ncbi:class I poly(R)-hydroxyalkanoic acid synthase [Rickettsiales endosymbiont of Peranema trichophorum]|uniref:PHA/PHB synthase family protein n=1 Tax=Rickettsiales endosymbiont of Peranema trichophorum TaxID=2486577 RepID=UPI001023EE95|nr:class I poly(R)-hydroxyalkanoic acid synthase [Rickettsiales endosymbiont of Peranema trichophorum]RZI46987.1 class I poly(R)-hydroxyalkanoic acid synthase [Rickettsiales endosymbiont of Peranema trichophorum]